MPSPKFVIGVAVALFAATGLVFAQPQRPDFSGTWVATKDAAPVVAAVFGERIAMKHTGQTLQIFRPTTRTEPWVTTHTLDGADTRVMLPGNTCFGQSGQIVTTAWDGSAIAYTITGSLSPGNPTPRPVSLKHWFKLTAPDTLVIEMATRTSATAEPTVVSGVYKSRTMLSTGSLVAFGFLCIVERDGGLVYTAMPNAAPPTDFVLTQVDADSATFENPTHDFPKMIRYVRKPDGTMEATISGDADRRPTTFVFKK